jgi:hypothetical protein
MPIERVLLTARPPTPDDWLTAARAVAPGAAVQVLPGSAAQLVDAGDALIATVVLPRRIAVPSEAARLLGAADPDRPWWTDVVAPAASPALEEVLAAISAACDGRVH